MPRHALPQLIPHKQMEFAPVEDDDDELSEFIKNDPLAHDNEWDLHEKLDGEQLENFWTDALQELGPTEAEANVEE
jgi:hypothetical protein